jgi:tetratricopeptide (TPR) repeat protein
MIRAGKYDAAIAAAKQGLDAHPEDPRLWTVEGIAYSLSHDDVRALECLKKALARSPSLPQALRAQASILSRRQDPSVIPVLRTILTKNPHDSTAHEMLGLAEAQSGDCTSALGEFTEAGADIKVHFSSLQQRAACLLETKAYPDAVSAFQSLQTSHPGDSGIRYDLALAQYESGDLNASQMTLSPLLDRAPDLDTLLLAADIFEQKGDTPHSVSLLRQAIVSAPNRSNSYIRFAELCMAHESYQAGIEMVTVGIEHQPHDSSLFLARGLLYGGLAKYDEAESDFKKAESYDPHHGTGDYAVGLIESQRNNPRQALVIVRKALEGHPEDAQLLYLLARLLLQDGAQPGTPNFTEATRMTERAVKLAPANAVARDQLAKIYFDMGNAAGAAEQCRAALAIDAADGVALYRLMRSLRATGDATGAQAIGQQIAAQHLHARDDESSKLRFRIETANSPDSQ